MIDFSPPKITIEEDTTRGRFLLVVPGANNLLIDAEFYSLIRPAQYQHIEPDYVADQLAGGLHPNWKYYCGIAKHVSLSGSQHFVATFLQVPNDKLGVIGPQLTNGHEFVVDPARMAKSQFHSNIMYVDNADRAMEFAMNEAHWIDGGLKTGTVWATLEWIFRMS